MTGIKKVRKKAGPIDRPFLFTLFTLIAIGLIMVFSASMYSSAQNGQSGHYQFLRQALFAVGGLAFMYYLSTVDYKKFKNQKFANIFFGICIILLFLVKFTPLGVQVNNAKRWFNLGITNFQPSELAKMAGIIYMSARICNNPIVLKGNFGNNENTKLLWLYCFIPMLLACGLTAIEPSMSAALALGIGMISVLWYGGIKTKQFLPFAVLAVIAGIYLVFKEPWRLSRIFAFFGQGTMNYQISQSLVGFGSGGIFGVGLGNGKQKLLFLPEIQNDFIFANIGEEFGLVGCLVVLFLYVYFIYRGLKIGIACKNKFGRLYVLSTMTLLAYQVLINVGVATATFPVTGMALPFISYGGTSIIILLATIGPILNISRNVDLRSKKDIKSNENSYGRRRNRGTYISRNSNS